MVAHVRFGSISAEMRRLRHVRSASNNGLISDVAASRFGGETRTSAALFDHPICTQQDGRRQFDADRLYSFEIHDRLEFARPLKRQVGRLRALYDLVDERCSAPK